MTRKNGSGNPDHTQQKPEIMLANKGGMLRVFTPLAAEMNSIVKSMLLLQIEYWIHHEPTTYAFGNWWIQLSVREMHRRLHKCMVRQTLANNLNALEADGYILIRRGEGSSDVQKIAINWDGVNQLESIKLTTPNQNTSPDESGQNLAGEGLNSSQGVAKNLTESGQNLAGEGLNSSQGVAKNLTESGQNLATRDTRDSTRDTTRDEFRDSVGEGPSPPPGQNPSLEKQAQALKAIKTQFKMIFKYWNADIAATFAQAQQEYPEKMAYISQALEIAQKRHRKTRLDHPAIYTVAIIKKWTESGYTPGLESDSTSHTKKMTPPSSATPPPVESAAKDEPKTKKPETDDFYTGIRTQAIHHHIWFRRRKFRPYDPDNLVSQPPGLAPPPGSEEEAEALRRLEAFARAEIEAEEAERKQKKCQQ